VLEKKDGEECAPPNGFPPLHGGTAHGFSAAWEAYLKEEHQPWFAHDLEMFQDQQKKDGIKPSAMDLLCHKFGKIFSIPAGATRQPPSLRRSSFYTLSAPQCR
jgi:hypothetical protein